MGGGVREDTATFYFFATSLRLKGGVAAVIWQLRCGYTVNLAALPRLVGITLAVMRLFAAVIGGGGNQPERLNVEGFSPSARSRGGASSQLSECRPSREERLKYANQRVTISFSEAARRSFDEKIFQKLHFFRVLPFFRLNFGHFSLLSRAPPSKFIQIFFIK